MRNKSGTAVLTIHASYSGKVVDTYTSRRVGSGDGVLSAEILMQDPFQRAIGAPTRSEIRQSDVAALHSLLSIF